MCLLLFSQNKIYQIKVTLIVIDSLISSPLPHLRLFLSFLFYSYRSSPQAFNNVQHSLPNHHQNNPEAQPTAQASASRAQVAGLSGQAQSNSLGYNVKYYTNNSLYNHQNQEVQRLPNSLSQHSKESYYPEYHCDYSLHPRDSRYTRTNYESNYGLEASAANPHQVEQSSTNTSSYLCNGSNLNYSSSVNFQNTVNSVSSNQMYDNSYLSSIGSSSGPSRATTQSSQSSHHASRSILSDYSSTVSMKAPTVNQNANNPASLYTDSQYYEVQNTNVTSSGGSPSIPETTGYEQAGPTFRASDNNNSEIHNCYHNYDNNFYEYTSCNSSNNDFNFLTTSSDYPTPDYYQP